MPLAILLRRPPSGVVLLLALLCAALALAGCARSRELQAGSYRAVLTLPGGELPFGLEVALEPRGPVLILVNGTERIRVEEVEVADGRLTARMPGFESVLTARVAGQRLRGEVTLVRPGGERVELPFAATLGETWRFHAAPLTDNADVAGRWAVEFTDDDGRTGSGVAEFEQTHQEVRGTFLTPTGDHRYLAGEVYGDELALSRFDGAGAYLYRARIDDGGALVGEYWSGRTGHRRFRAERDADATLDPSPVRTELREPGVELAFSFPDLDGRPVSLADPAFDGKVVIVTLAGSWCPNCHDEAAFLAPLHRRYRAQGLEVVSLMFEYHGGFAEAAAATRRFRERYDIEYATLIAGVSDKDEASQALPQLTGVHAFPTTIFLDRGGRVRKIHAGFSGPATGAHYDRLTAEFTALVEQLLAEPAASATPGAAASGTPAPDTLPPAS